MKHGVISASRLLAFFEASAPAETGATFDIAALDPADHAVIAHEEKWCPSVLDAYLTAVALCPHGAVYLAEPRSFESTLFR